MTIPTEPENRSAPSHHDVAEEGSRTEIDVREQSSPEPAGAGRPNRPEGGSESAAEFASVLVESAEVVRTRDEHLRRAGEPRQRADPTAGMPLPDYQRLTVPEIIRHAESLPAEGLRELKDYEKSHRRRKTLLTKLERLLRSHDREPKSAPTSRPAASEPAGEAHPSHRA
jgi:hypothetical protein